MFFKIGVLKNVPIFTGKDLCWSLFLIKLQAWRSEKKHQRRCFPVNIAKILRTVNFHRRPPLVAFASTCTIYICTNSWLISLFELKPLISRSLNRAFTVIKILKRNTSPQNHTKMNYFIRNIFHETTWYHETTTVWHLKSRSG